MVQDHKRIAGSLVCICSLQTVCCWLPLPYPRNQNFSLFFFFFPRMQADLCKPFAHLSCGYLIIVRHFLRQGQNLASSMSLDEQQVDLLELAEQELHGDLFALMLLLK